MFSAKPVEEARLFTAMLSSDERLFEIAGEILRESCGPVAITSPVYPWIHSRYYEEEYIELFNRARERLFRRQ